MKKQKSLRKKPKKPLFFKKSKAAKEEEKYDELYETEASPLQKQYENSPSRVKKRSKYNREYEYSDYDDEYEGKVEDSMQTKENKQSPSRMKTSSKYNREYEYIDYNDDQGVKNNDSLQTKQYKNSPRIRKSSRYNREYEYTDYDDEHGGNQYNYVYDREMYDSGDEMLEYTTEDTSRHRRHPKRNREYYDRPETEYIDDSDSDCLACTSRSGHKSNYTSEYPSEYQSEDMKAPRYRNMYGQSLRKRQMMPSEIEVERSPYHQIRNRFRNRKPYSEEIEEEFDYRDSPGRNYFESNYRETPYHRMPQEVYVAQEPVSHKVVKLRKQYKPEKQTLRSTSEVDLDDYDEEEEEEGIEEPGWGKNLYQSQIFAANIEENQGVFQKQQRQNPREKLLSVTEYDQSVPMIALKSTRATKPQDESQSIVYLPVVVMDDNIKLPNSKVVHAESILRTVGDKAEKPLETNMHVYLETENGQGNIFQQAQRNVMQGIASPKNIPVYTAQSTHSMLVNKKPSLVSKIVSTIKATDKSKSDYPVQKSYINVVPSKARPVEQKGSKISIKSGGPKKSSTSLLVGNDKPNSPTGSAYYAKVHKKELKDKKGRTIKRKITSDESSSALLSVINPASVGNPPDEPGKSTIMFTNRGKNKQKSIQPSASQIFQRNPTSGKTQPTKTNLTKQSSFDRNVSLLKQPNRNKTEGRENTVNKDERTPSVLERQCSNEKDSKIITIKDVTNGQYEESKNVFEADFQPQTDDSATAFPKKKGIGGFFHKKEQSKDFTPKHAPPIYDPYTFNPDEYTSPTSSLAVMQKNKRKEDDSGKRKVKKSPSGKKILTKTPSLVDISKKTEEFHFWDVLNFNSHAFFTYIYQVVQYFLGLTIHGTLMEILRNSKQSD